MCIDQIINIIIGVCTLSASLIALFTLLEIKRQRKESNKPEPAIKSCLVHIYGMKFKNYYFPFNFSQELYKDENSIANAFLSDFYIELVNVGIRSAKNILVEWNFDFNKTLELIEKDNKDGLFKININSKLLEILFPLNEYKEFNMIENQMGSKCFDFLLNSTPESFDTIRLMFPRVVLKLYLIKLCLVFGYYKKDEKDKNLLSRIDPLDFPDLELKINYEDIAGVPYLKRFVLRINLVTFTNPMTTELKHLVGTLQIKADEVKN
ncbi:MAG: hypothetical protein ACOXZO_00080 [Bacteroidales bacterium]|jgi:hypothetical protein